MLKKIVIVINLIFVGLAVSVVIYSFFAKSTYTVSTQKTFPYPQATIWKVLTDKRGQINWRKDIIKQSTDTNEVTKVWAEYFTEKDSVDYTLLSYQKPTKYAYQMHNRKFELISEFSYELIPIDDKQTKITVTENTKSYNRWASVFFLFNKNDLNLQVEINRLEDGLRHQ